MRHFLANLAVYVLAIGLVIGALLFAWVRSAQIVITTERSVEPPGLAAAADLDEFAWEAFGQRVYVANCQNCHASDGRGRDVYPPIIGQHTVAAAPGGRDFLIRSIIYGLATRAHPTPMPPMPNLSDAQVAAVLNYTLTRFDQPAHLPDRVRLYIPSDVTLLRGEGLSERDVGRMRPAVPLPGELDRLNVRTLER